MSATHEDFGREVKRRGPSNRSFGLVFTAAFLLFGLAPLRHGNPVRPIGLALAAGMLLAALARPGWLALPNRLWFSLGGLLGRLINPVIMALLFYLVFTPAAVLLRWMGKDLLDLAIRPEAESYWIPRAASEPRSEMTDQF